MRLTTRLRTVEATFRPDAKEPQLVIAPEGEAGNRRDGRGNVVDPATTTGPLRVIRLVRWVRHEVPGGAPVGPSA